MSYYFRISFILQFLMLTLTLMSTLAIPLVAASVPGDLGPLEIDHSNQLSIILSPVPVLRAYRVEVFSKPKTLDISLKSTSGWTPYFQIEGPLPENGDHTAVGTGTIAFKSPKLEANSTLQTRVTLAQAGVYRLVVDARVLSAPEPRSALLSIDASCVEGCHRDVIPFSNFISKLKRENRLQEVTQPLLEVVNHFVSDPIVSKSLVDEFNQILTSSDSSSLDAFPKLSLAHFGKIRDLLAVTKTGRTAQPDAVLHGTLETLLGPCDVPRDDPTPLNGCPQLKYGHFADHTLTDCQSAHSRSFAKILTSLSVGNLSSVTFGEKNYSTPEDLISALIKSGHEVRLRRERTFANFLSFTIDDQQDLQWPVWLDTGLIIKGEPLVIPAGHSQHAYWISGPTVNARVSIFLGMYGAAFFGQTDTRPHWVGRRAISDISSLTDSREILKSIQGARLYLSKNRFERATIAAGNLEDGYILLGDCNDTDAALEKFTRGTYSSYPLLRDRRFDQNCRPDDFFCNLMSSLPDDTRNSARNRSDDLRRIALMAPFTMDSKDWFDEKLKFQMQAVAAELNTQMK